MNKNEFTEKIKLGIKSPSPEFTNKVMSEISTLNSNIPFANFWIVKFLYIASLLLFVLSIFVKLPQIEIFNYTIKFSPIVFPILSLIFIFIVFNQLEELKNTINKFKNLSQQPVVKF